MSVASDETSLAQGETCPLCLAGALTPLPPVAEYSIAACAACASVYASQAPTTSYDEAYFDAGYLRFEAERIPFLRQLLTGLGSGGGKSLLDVGCGVGLSLTVAREGGWNAYGCDSSEAAVRLAKDRGERVVEGDAESLPFESSSAAALLILDVLAHVADARAAMSEAARVLAPGCPLILKTPYRPPRIYKVCSRMPGSVGADLAHLPAQRRALSPDGVRSLLAASGFVDVTVARSREAIPRHKALKTGPVKARLGLLASCLLEIFTGPPSLVVSARARD
jgi:SAM-dependent methyltransferase